MRLLQQHMNQFFTWFEWPSQLTAIFQGKTAPVQDSRVGSDNEHLRRIIISWTKTKAVWPMKQSVYNYKRLGLAGKTANLVKSIMNQYL